MASFNGWRVTRAGVVFIIVAIVLAIAVFAGVRIVQQRGEQARTDEATKIALENQENSETPAIAEETPAPAQEDTVPNSTQPGGHVAATSPETLPETGVSSILPILLLAAATYGGTRLVRERRTVTQG